MIQLTLTDLLALLGLPPLVMGLVKLTPPAEQADFVTNLGNILKEQGIEPAPVRKRQTTWGTFLRVHWEVLAAIDFTTIEVWTKNGLVTYYLLFVMELVSRRVHFAGATVSPEEPWMKQIARNLTDADTGFLHGKRYLLMDRDSVFCASFRATLRSSSVLTVRLQPRSPNLATSPS